MKINSKNNRQYKDSVFVDLFGTDIKAGERLLSLYSALSGQELDKGTPIRYFKLEQVLYMGFYNDVSCLIDDKIIVLAEHQSTVNENMPLRFLEYVARLYEQFQEPKEKYQRKLIKIPCPEFYVFYNGLEDFPVSKTLRLSDAFMAKRQQVNLELIVQAININHNKSSELLAKCKPLEEYSLFIETARRHIELDSENGFDNAVKECLENDILREYLQRKAKEVINMLTAEYDYATDIAVQREEAAKEAAEKTWQKAEMIGIQKGSLQNALQNARNLKNLGIPLELISQGVGLSVEEIENL